MKIIRIALLLLLGILVVSGVACCPAPTGENIYSRFGFSFEYPAGVHIYEEGLFLPTADENSGLVGWATADEALSLGWWKTIIWDSEMAEDGIDGALETMETDPEVEAFEYIGDKVATSMSGFNVMYQLFEITMWGEERSGIVGIWYCEPGTTAFWATFLVTDASMPYLEDFMLTFRCQ